ncbi:MAG: HigA family addiction module antidote protein [Bacteroidales bacterium]|nr:HigA family addiction module antidote protein [Bacteroidales bacterium]
METNNIKSEFATYTNPHPGILLSEELEARGISYEDFSKRSGIAVEVIKNIADGKQDITTDIAAVLESVLNIDAKTWLNLQRYYDTWPERRAAYEAAHPEVPRSKVLLKIQKSHKKGTVKVDGNKDWQSVVDSIIEFVKGKGLGETKNLQITFDAQPV